jgi:hypothetical protein
MSEDDPSELVPRRYCEGCGLELPSARKNRRYHDSAGKQEGYRKRRMKALEKLLQEACCLLNSYADIVTEFAARKPRPLMAGRNCRFLSLE